MCCERTCRECLFSDRSGIIGDDPNVGDATCIHLVGSLNQCFHEDPNAAAEECGYFTHLDTTMRFQVTERPTKWDASLGAAPEETRLLTAEEFVQQYPNIAHLVVGDALAFEGMEYRAGAQCLVVTPVATDCVLT